MTQKIKTTQEQRAKFIQLILAIDPKDNQCLEANAVAKFLGFKEGVTAEIFEHIIAKDGLNMQVICAIAKYYANEIKAEGY